MYAPGYGFQVSNVPPTFNNAAPPPNQNPHMQQGSGPTQPGQQMMYNPNQFAGMSGGQPGFVGGPNPAMMSGAGPAGMMQNAGMPHMAANGQMAFQNPYQGNPYGGNMPAPGGQHPNFGGMQGFPMNAAMTPQQQQQIMMQQQQQRKRWWDAVGIDTAKTDERGARGSRTATVNGTSTVSTPLSPGSESREQERFSLLLEINQELLYESMQLQHTLTELKKEAAPTGEGDPARKPSQEEAAVQQDYSHCMRRLQANLAYLAALADRKGNVQVPPSPAYLSSPPLNMTLKVRLQTPPGDVAENNPDPTTDRQERSSYLTELYNKLQALFPNVDPKKEPAFQTPARPQGQHPGQQGMAQGQRPPSHQASPGMAQAQRPMQMQNMPGSHQSHGMVPS
ncbi:hypothetical protein K4K61_008184 [Colletotrichum sp. SAR11_59]|nr:hypothetical protein K4K50_011897 [Colletotrichum sp. SAR 10_71]KAI8150777.1 hypothetical protein KHU50_012767 [Colletotrichum sp. SAR 10_65]KAI8157511.1 hypothetical protein K4K49_008351 [Colletotrichum sp. SAR 10_70]KAI8175106.1 hypothetical protein K4K51_007878 [Colletotrichum sp. SAR 10_75]KAI8196558.1 hypothetical protein K4K52_011287 [Colletotrichum sp. SAR 10_76]KAI8217214.1 hypothetical protein K4K53_009375 [Colletotrichum sp. SAR 10_77]KAI8217223.1 hypothetical protein K4K54_01188